MFTTLPESRRVPSRAGGTAASFIAHYGLVLALVYASADAATPREAPRQEVITFQQPASPRPDPAPPPEMFDAPPPFRAPGVLVPPLTIPATLPAIDLGTGERHWVEFSPGPGTFSAPSARATREAPADPDAVYLDLEVERAAEVTGSVPPAYPDALRRAGIEGDVVVSFVVDTLGRADMTTYRVIRATHALFARAVREAVSRERFRPAEVGTLKVRQLVQQPFAFTIVPR